MSWSGSTLIFSESDGALPLLIYDSFMMEVLLGCASDSFMIALGFSVFYKFYGILTIFDLERAHGVAL